MNWSISAVGKDGKSAKKALRAENEKRGEDMRCPDKVLEQVDAMVDLLPKSTLEGYDAVSVGTHGYFVGKDDPEGNCSLAIQVLHVENTAAQ